MTATTTEEQLRQLREGDQLQYHGVQWMVKDYSTYTDPKGYETEEWLLKTRTGKEYYLMREVDPHAAGTNVAWYLAEEVKNPSIYEADTAQEVTWNLADEMLAGKDPYPKLQIFNRIYLFESKSEGTYRSEYGLRTRITWDYWDEPHLWNLALETWANGSLNTYSTRPVQPADFTDLQKSDTKKRSSAQKFRSSPRETKKKIALAITIIGFFLMLFGI